MTSRRLFGAATLLALGASGLLGGTATASPSGGTPAAGDDRAVPHAKNLEWNHENACARAGLAGQAFDEEGTPTLPSTQTDTHVTITGGLEGYTVTGVVVKGGDGYNVYFTTPPEGTKPLGDLPWEGLHSPLNPNGKPAGISHWFFCAEKTTSEEPGGENPGGENPGGENPGGENPGGENPGGENPGGENPGEETEEVTPTSTTSVAVTPTSTSAPVAAPVADDNDLANTGFDGGWLLVVGLGLVAAGAAFVASPKLRGLLRR
ncbi:hypothetical protein ACWEFJ_16510 [Actinosynnema sp. NPDC004786]